MKERQHRLSSPGTIRYPSVHAFFLPKRFHCCAPCLDSRKLFFSAPPPTSTLLSYPLPNKTAHLFRGFTQLPSFHQRPPPPPRTSRNVPRPSPRAGGAGCLCNGLRGGAQEEFNCLILRNARRIIRALRSTHYSMRLY